MDYRNGVRQVSVFNMGGEKVIYLSGAITGKDREDYLSEFSYYEEKLSREWNTFDTDTGIMEDVKVINPAKVCDQLPKLEQRQYMHFCMELLALCDTIYLLPGWENSEGAKQELSCALAMKMRVEVAPVE